MSETTDPTYPGGVQITLLPGELVTKPADNDLFIMVDVSGENEVIRAEYGTLKQHFLMTDENRDINADLEFQDTCALKFGNTGELQIVFDGTDSRVTTNEGKMYFQLKNASGTTKNMLILNPDENTIAIGDANLNNDGESGKGINIFTTGHVQCLQTLTVFDKLTVKGDINTGAKHINDTGSDSTGLTFSNGNGTFENNLTVKGTLSANSSLTVSSDLNVTGQINAKKTGSYSMVADGPVNIKGYLRMGDNQRINHVNASSGGLKFYSTGAGEFLGSLVVDDTLSVNSNVNISTNLFVESGIETISEVKCRHINIQHSIQTPTAETNRVSLFIHSADNKPKLVYPDGTVKEILTT